MALITMTCFQAELIACISNKAHCFPTHKCMTCVIQLSSTKSNLVISM
jgi:hypothetical protein